MGMNLDTKERAERRNNLRNDKLDKITMYSVTDLEPIIGVTHRTLLGYIKQGRLKAVKIGGKWRVSEKNLMKFLNGE